MNNKTFATDNFQLASYLLAESIKLIGHNPTDPRRMVFIFEESNRRKDLTEKFLSYKALVEPHRLYSAEKDIKNMIHQNKRR